MNNNNNVYDIEKGVRLAGGNQTLALELFNMLIKQLPEHKIEISESFDSNELTDLKQHVHRLHGSSQCCGTTALTIAVKEFETIIGKNFSDRFSSCYEKLLFEIDRVLMIDIEFPDTNS